MTISTTSNTTIAQGNGLTTSFSFPFPVPLTSELSVYFTDTTGIQTTLLPSQYSVTGIGTPNGGAVTYPLTGSPIATGTSLTIQRLVPYQQLTDLVNQSGYYPNVVENALDYLTMQTQQLAQLVSLSLQVPLANAAPNLVFPGVSNRSNKLAGFDINGNAAVYPITASVGAGNLTPEGPFVANVNFTPGVTTTLTLSQAYGTPANVRVQFDGIGQGFDQYSISGNQIIFTSPIPVGISKVYIVGGTTLSIYIPPNLSVGDAQLAWGSILGRSCNTVAALAALNVAIYARAFVVGYAVLGDGGGGAYFYSASTPQASANGGSIVAATGGVGCWILQHNGTVSVKQFGAKGDGATDDTAAFQAAIATGLHIYIPAATVNYYMKSGNIACVTAGQKIYGDGKDRSILQVDTGFNMSATGLFVCSISSGGEGPSFEEFQVNYVQPDTAVRANLTTYPVTFYAQAEQRATWVNVKVQNASNIIDMRNNPGGNNIVGCEFSWYNVAINIDGAVDSVKLDRCHFWPFAMTANQMNIFYDVNCIAVNSGRCDDLHVDSCLFISGQQIVAYQSSLGSTFGNVTNTDFDTNIGIRMSAGSLGVAACFFSNGFAAGQAIIMTGGRIQASECDFGVSTTLTNAQISIQGGGAIFQMTNSYMEPGGADMTSIAMAANTTVMLNNNNFNHTPGFSPAAAVVTQLGGVLTFTNNRINAKGGGTGAFLALTTDDAHVIANNSFNGWQIGLPSTVTNFMPVDNQGIANGDYVNGFVVGTLKTRYYTGVATGTGTIVLAHGVTALNQKIFSCSAGSRGSAGQWAPMTVTSVDGTNISATGGTVSAAVRICIQYTETQQGW